MSFFRPALGRSLSVLRCNGPALLRCARPAARFIPPLKFPSSNESRVLKLLNPQQSFFTSAKQSIRSYYPPPPRPQGTSFLSFLDKIPQNAVLYGIMALNGVVFAMWYAAKQQLKINKDPELFVWMHQNFLSSWRNIREGRVWTAINACFSHNDFGHILFNGFTFFFMSPIVLQILGSRKFILFYLTGLASTGVSLIYSHYIDRKDVPSHGASGAIYGITTFLACVAPRMTFQLYGIVPVPAWLVVTALFSYDAYSTYTDKRGTTDTVGHIGGMLSGVVYFILLRRPGRIM